MVAILSGLDIIESDNLCLKKLISFNSSKRQFCREMEAQRYESALRMQINRLPSL